MCTSSTARGRAHTSSSARPLGRRGEQVRAGAAGACRRRRASRGCRAPAAPRAQLATASPSRVSTSAMKRLHVVAGEQAGLVDRLTPAPRRRAGPRCRPRAGGSGRARGPASCMTRRRARPGAGSGARRPAGSEYAESSQRSTARRRRAPGGRTRRGRSPPAAARRRAGVISRQTTRPPGRTTRASSRKPRSTSAQVAHAERDGGGGDAVVRSGSASASAWSSRAARHAGAVGLARARVEHARREVDARSPRRPAPTTARELEREVAGPAAAVEHAGAAADPGLRRRRGRASAGRARPS